MQEDVPYIPRASLSAKVGIVGNPMLFLERVSQYSDGIVPKCFYAS